MSDSKDPGSLVHCPILPILLLYGTGRGCSLVCAILVINSIILIIFAPMPVSFLTLRPFRYLGAQPSLQRILGLVSSLAFHRYVVHRVQIPISIVCRMWIDYSHRRSFLFCVSIRTICPGSLVPQFYDSVFRTLHDTAFLVPSVLVLLIC